MLALNTLNVDILFRHFEFWPQLHLTDLEISWLDCLTPKTYALTPRNNFCAAQYLKYWIRKVDGGHLGKWRPVQIAHTSDDVITQFLDPHTAMINFRHADNCCYSAATYSKTGAFFSAPAAALICFVLVGLSHGKYKSLVKLAVDGLLVSRQIS